MHMLKKISNIDLQMSYTICFINSYEWKFEIFFHWKQNPHDLLHDISTYLRVQVYYVTIFNCKNALCITLHILKYHTYLSPTFKL